MNIFDVQFSPLKLNSVRNNSQQARYYLMNNPNTDTFESENKTQQISFKANFKPVQKTAEEILNNPELSKKFAGFLVTGFTSLVALAMGKEAVKKDDKLTESDVIAEAFSKINAENNESVVDEEIIDVEKENYIQEIERLKAENKKLKDELEQKRETISTEDSSQNAIENKGTKIDDSENFVKVEFPKKHGRLSKEQIELKKIVEEIEIKKGHAEKLTELCKIAITSKENILEKFGFDTEYLIEQIPKHTIELSVFEEFIDKTYERYKSSVAENSTEENVGDISEKTEQEIFIPAGEEEELSSVGIKVVGAIPLEQLARAKKPTKIASVDPKGNINIEQTRPAKVLNPKKDYQSTEVATLDKENGIFDFKIPGTLDPSLKNNLTRLLLRFQDLTKAQNGAIPKWMHKQSLVENVFEQDIIGEINHRNKGTSPYRNLKVENSTEIMEILNSEPRFNELFDLHSALRFIDRFVNLDSEEPLKEQCGRMLDKFYVAIQKALSNGVKIETYQDSRHNAYAPRIVIKPDKIKNPEAYEIFGSYDTMITICENQSKPGYYDKYNKTPLISTIFSKGLY